MFLTDILDLFLSSLGPAPKNAIKEIILSPFGVYVWAYMYFCCFLSNGERDFFLGPSLKGYSLDEQFTGCWKTMLTIASQHLMVPINEMELLCVSKAYQTQGRVHTLGTVQKHCRSYTYSCEYPNAVSFFIFFILIDRKHLNTPCQIIYNLAGLSNPCQNCEEPIEMCDGRAENFMG